MLQSFFFCVYLFLQHYVMVKFSYIFYMVCSMSDKRQTIKKFVIVKPFQPFFFFSVIKFNFLIKYLICRYPLQLQSPLIFYTNAHFFYIAAPHCIPADLQMPTTARCTIHNHIKHLLFKVIELLHMGIWMQRIYLYQPDAKFGLQGGLVDIREKGK